VNRKKFIVRKVDNGTGRERKGEKERGLGRLSGVSGVRKGSKKCIVREKGKRTLIRRERSKTAEVSRNED